MACRTSRRPDDGHSLVEFILLMPLLFLLIVNIVNFGGFFYSWITLADAARVGAQDAALNKLSVGGLSPATGPQVATLVSQDTSTLVNAASLQVNVCQNNNGTVTTLHGVCLGVPADPEPASFILASADVTYTYQPMLPLFSIPSLHVTATLPPQTIRSRVYMRVFK